MRLQEQLDSEQEKNATLSEEIKALKDQNAKLATALTSATDKLKAKHNTVIGSDDLNDALISACKAQCLLPACVHPHVQDAIMRIPAKMGAIMRQAEGGKPKETVKEKVQPLGKK